MPYQALDILKKFRTINWASMAKITHINSKLRNSDYAGIPAGVTWTIPIHECLQSEANKAKPEAIRAQAKQELSRENREQLISYVKTIPRY